MNNDRFKILKKDKASRARLGLLNTPHGRIHTPTFVPVATKGALRGVDFGTINGYGASIFMMNTFHFYHNGRYELVKRMGGLHRFLNTPYPIMTDSGGFQVFSYGFSREHGVGKISDIFPNEGKGDGVKGKNMVKITSEGTEFISPIDGSKLALNPEISMKVQKDLGADIIFAFDECTSPLASYEYTKEALGRTHSWAKRSLKAFRSPKEQALFGIVQGGEYRDLREESAEYISSLPFAGFGIGGSLGKSKEDMHEILDWVTPLLDDNRPRHLLGIGEVDDIFEGVERGMDMFDCVIPTRWARHGTAFTSKGRKNMKSALSLTQKEPIDKECKCKVCQTHSVAYISHLLREKEVYGIMLLTEHNLAWITKMMQMIREALKKDEFKQLKRKLLRYH